MLTLPTDSTNTEYLIRPTLAMQIGTARAWAEAMKALGAQIANDRADLLIVPVVDIEAEKLALIRTLSIALAKTSSAPSLQTGNNPCFPQV